MGGEGRESGSLWGYRSMVKLPARAPSPLRELIRRALMAFGLVVVNTLIVYLDRGSYSDNVNHDGVSLVDAFYYATVTVTTTGYGDITPVSDHARLLNAILVTPLRVAFLVLLVGTTLEVLANEGRRALSDSKWRKRMRNHTVVLGYGTMGRSAVSTLLRQGVDKEKIVVVDQGSAAVAAANRDGLAAFEGHATSRDLLNRAEVPKAREVIITVNRDDTAILATLTVRQLNPRVHVVVAVREAANVALVKQGGANAVVTSSDSVGRLVGLSTVSPELGSVMDDLLSAGEGLEVAQRIVEKDEVGRNPADLDDRVIAVVRNKSLRKYYDPTCAELKAGDEVVVVRQATRPGPELPPE